MSDVADRDAGLSRARLLVVVWLVSAVLSVVVLPLVGVAREPSTSLRVAGLVGIGGLLAAQLLAMWSAVTPWASPRTHRRAQALLVVAAVGSVPLVGPVAAVDWATWAWLGASIVGTAPLVWRWPTAALVVVAATLTSVAVAVVLDAGRLTYLAVTLGIGSGLALLNRGPLWLWELLVRADAARLGGARAAAAEERHRFGRDVHDVLGHDLTVIALKAELAARTAASDPVSSARESEEVRALAEAALGRMRRTVAGEPGDAAGEGGEPPVDLDDQVAATRAVLATAGVRCEVDAAPVRVSPEVSGVLSMVLREASTNLLRHSDATWCRVGVRQDGARVRLSVDNDRPRSTGTTGSPAAPMGASVPGSGLDGLRWRLAAVGGDLSTHRDDTSYRLLVTVPSEHG